MGKLVSLSTRQTHSGAVLTNWTTSLQNTFLSIYYVQDTSLSYLGNTKMNMAFEYGLSLENPPLVRKAYR